MRFLIFIILLMTPATLFAGVTNAIGSLGSLVEIALWGLLAVAIIIAWLVYSAKKMKEINKKDNIKN